MTRNKPKLTRYQKRLFTLLTGVEEEEMRELLLQVIAIESKNRSAQRFPLHQIREVIDTYASLEEDGLFKKDDRAV